MEYQKTIKKEFRLTGPGLHTGRTVTVTVIPAPENFGIAFRRTDRTNIVTQPALADNVGETSRGTTLGTGRNSIATIEHLMSALHGSQIDNALIELDGGEVPIIDGSARPWMLQLSRVGVQPLQAERKSYTIKEPLHFEFAKTGSVFEVEPCDHFSVHCEIDFADTVIGRQTADMNDFSEYAASIAPCRTFVFLHEVEPLLHLNLIKGGSLDNALVFVNREASGQDIQQGRASLQGARRCAQHHGHLLPQRAGTPQTARLCWRHTPCGYAPQREVQHLQTRTQGQQRLCPLPDGIHKKE